MNELEIFTNDDFGEIRIITIDENPWFIAKDVSDILGYRMSSDMTRRIDSDDKGTHSVSTLGGTQNMGVINESGLYSAILGSKLPGAKKFKHWVTSEVLPSIRKHGAYMTEQTLEKALTSPNFLIQLATQLKEEQTARKLAEQKIEEQKPKVEFHDAVHTSTNSISVGKFSGVLQKRQELRKMGRNKLFQWFRDNNFLCECGDLKNKPTQKSLSAGYMDYEENVTETPYGNNVTTYKPLVTGKGQTYFTKKLLKEFS